MKCKNVFDLTMKYGIAYDNKQNYFLFDLEDYEIIKQHYWRVDKNGYACRKEKGKILYLHRLLMGCNCKEKEVDHINHQRADNRKQNLRVCSRQENLCNTPIHKNNKSGFKGVYFEKNTKKWATEIRVKGKHIKLGLFKRPEEAYEAYCEASRLYHGEYGSV